MDKNRLALFFNTLKHLKLKQVFYQCYYRVISVKRKSSLTPLKVEEFKLQSFPCKNNVLQIENSSYNFTFLNQKKSFSKKDIDFGFKGFGLLWAYNLNYFEFLLQKNITKKEGITLLYSFYEDKRNSILNDPYPISLRINNVIKFNLLHNINDNAINKNLYADLDILNKKIEYHIMANHLLENAFALFVGAYYFNDKEKLNKARCLLENQLKEQILNDGMHYERSIMYHSIILERLLDTINLIDSNQHDPILRTLKSFSVKMTGFLKNWESFNQPPMMQDATNGIALAQKELLSYAKRLLGDSYPKTPSLLSDSNYRILNQDSLQIVANVGQISPSYQPGHAHADELNFELYYKGTPLIVDRGISTYEKNTKRQIERSTIAHNCLCINNENSSEIWGGFRVAKRASVTIEEAENTLSASMKTVKGKRIKRAWSKVVNEFMIHDRASKFNPTKDQIIGRLHFHPEVSIEVIDSSSLLLNNEIKIISSSASFSKKRYQYSMGFNNQVEASCVEYHIDNNHPENVIAISVET